MRGFASKPPAWFWLVSALIVIWGGFGVFAFYSDVTMSREAIDAMSEYDRQLYLSRPGWMAIVYAIATWGGLLGGVAMLLRRRLALILFLISLIAIVVQFGWVFGATDLIAAKGAWTMIFPAVILIVALLQIWFASAAAKRGWLR